MITDKLASYRAAKREVILGIEHRQHKGLNNRAENSRQPTRRRERQMNHFKSAGQAQRFLSAGDEINGFFRLRRDHVTAAEHRASRTQIFEFWAESCSELAIDLNQLPVTQTQLTRCNKLTVRLRHTLARCSVFPVLHLLKGHQGVAAIP
jgi:hypothetical protein